MASDSRLQWPSGKVVFSSRPCLKSKNAHPGSLSTRERVRAHRMSDREGREGASAGYEPLYVQYSRKKHRRRMAIGKRSCEIFSSHFSRSAAVRFCASRSAKKCGSTCARTSHVKEVEEEGGDGRRQRRAHGIDRSSARPPVG